MTRDGPAEVVADRNMRLADYVLGQMNAAEAALFERDMAADSALAREVRDLRERLVELDAAVEPLPATESLWDRIAVDVARTQTTGAAEAARAAQGRGRDAGIWGSLAFWRTTGLAATAAALVLVAGLAAALSRGGGEPSFVAVLVNDGDLRPGAIVEIDSDGMTRLITLEDIPVPAGRALQVWTLQDRQAGPQSVGLIREARSTTLETGGLPPARADQLFEITLEPETGSPTGRPTGPVLFKGTTSRAL